MNKQIEDSVTKIEEHLNSLATNLPIQIGLLRVEIEKLRKQLAEKN